MVDAVVQAYVDLGLRASIAPQFSDLPSYYGLADLETLLPADLREQIDSRPRFPQDEVMAVLQRAIERWDGAAGGRIRFGAAPMIATVCSDELLRACAELTGKYQVPLQMHLAETKGEAYTARRAHGKSTVARLSELGVLTPRTLLAHTIWVDDDDLDLIARNGCSVAHNPVGNLRLGDGVCPLLELRERGCNVALGTDGAASNDNQNMFGVLKLAATLHRVLSPDYETWPSPADVFTMATANGARALGFEGQIGRVAAGMLADLVLLDLRKTYYHPRNNLVNQLVLCEVGSSITTVLVAGRVVLEHGDVTTVDEQALLDEADEIGQRITRDLLGDQASIRRLEAIMRQAYLQASRAELPINRCV
jgi:5-methylthioadenosine/S-adenosylhomocysteine deaminase